MEHKQHDAIVRKKMLAEIADVEMFTATLDAQTFADSRLAQKAVMMSLINMKAVRGLRNIAAHHFDSRFNHLGNRHL